GAGGEDARQAALGDRGGRLGARSLRPAANAAPPRKYVRPRSVRSSGQPAPDRGRCRRSRYRARTGRAGRAAAPTACAARRGPPAYALLLLPRAMTLLYERAAISVVFPSPLWGGVGGRGPRGARPPCKNKDPPPQPSPSRLRACPLPAKFKLTEPRQAGVRLGEGAHRVRGESLSISKRNFPRPHRAFSTSRELAAGGVAVAAQQMVVDHAGRLHERVDDG